MTDENANTADLTDRELLTAILRRLEALEAKADDRAKETRPKLDLIVKEISDLREDMKTIRREMGLLREDIRGERLHRAELAERIEDLERRPN